LFFEKSNFSNALSPMLSLAVFLIPAFSSPNVADYEITHLLIGDRRSKTPLQSARIPKHETSDAPPRGAIDQDPSEKLADLARRRFDLIQRHRRKELKMDAFQQQLMRLEREVARVKSHAKRRRGSAATDEPKDIEAFSAERWRHRMRMVTFLAVAMGVSTVILVALSVHQFFWKQCRRRREERLPTALVSTRK
jgi:hypothetical protein